MVTTAAVLVYTTGTHAADLTLSSYYNICGSEPLVLSNDDPQATDQPSASHPSHTHTHTPTIHTHHTHPYYKYQFQYTSAQGL